MEGEGEIGEEGGAGFASNRFNNPRVPGASDGMKLAVLDDWRMDWVWEVASIENLEIEVEEKQ